MWIDAHIATPEVQLPLVEHEVSAHGGLSVGSCDVQYDCLDGPVNYKVHFMQLFIQIFRNVTKCTYVHNTHPW